MRPLEGQRALVTGANSGIGAAIARAFAGAGAKVLVNYHSDGDAAEKVVADIVASAGEAAAAEGDVSDPVACARLFEAMDERYGGLDILVSNAGLQQDAPFTEMTLDQWRRVLDVDLTGGFLCAQHAVRRFRQQGLSLQRSAARGKVIFVSSVHERIPWAGHANYAAAKGGLKLLMESLALEVAPERIRVNAIAPGAIRTPINRKTWDRPEAAEKLQRLIPYGRIGDPADVGKAAVWLASDESDYVVGATLFVDGGMTLYPAFRASG